MIHVKNSTQYYINERALTFSENDLDNANRVAVSLVSGTVILVHVPGTIDYASDGNYERWSLKGYSTRLVNAAAHYVYARLSRTDRTALIVFSVKNYNIDGSITTVTGTDENGNDITETTDPSADYFFIRIGEITATDSADTPTVNRELTYDSGLLSTDKGNSMTDPNDMWELDQYSTPWLIRAKHWLTSFTLKGFITLIGGLIFKNAKGEEKQIVDVMRSTDSGDPNDANYVPIDDTTIPTTAWIQNRSDDRYLKKYEPDETHYRIKFFDGIEAGYFVKGMIGGSGTQFDGDGYGEMNGLTLREFLEVPELRFNRIDVVSGELWNSVAFGLIEKVDTAQCKAWVKLEERERCGLHVYDICRGIFADFGDGTQWEGVDECGFLHLYGFWTSYFTPTEIIESGEGVFCFRYELKAGTTQHPTQSMKFAVYGNFVDSSRQASAYSTRTYKRYLNKVDTWVIDPDKNIYAQYGDLNGLTIGGQEMTGYGSFQSNSYFTGVQIQFTPQQKLELQGESAYSVTLSDYEGVVTIDDEGNIIGGETELLNVITDGENVITDGQNVVTAGYKLQTQVQAMLGSTPLYYSPASPSEGAYTIAINSVGCTAMILNGVVVVTSVFYTERCYVTIIVNCEGKASFTQTYHITAVRDGKNPIMADIDNEMDSVACDSAGKVLFGLPVSCTVSMWAGTQNLSLDSLSITNLSDYVDENNNPTVTASADHTTGIVKVTAIADSAPRAIPLNITAYASYGGTQYHKDLVFTVNKVNAGENALLYKLSPSASSVKVDDAGNMTATSIKCEVVSSDGSTIQTLDKLPSGVTMQYYRDDEAAKDYSYNSAVSVNSGTKTVTFKLYAGDNLIDVETIPILLDGSSPLIVDLDNEMQSVACDEYGTVVLGLPLSTGVKAFYGSKELTISSITLGTVSGVTASVSGTTVKVTAITKDAVENIRLPITVKASHDKEYTRTVYLIVNKLKQGEAAAVVDLVPSVSSIKIDSKGAYSPTTISCMTKVTTGKQGTTTPTAIPENYTMKWGVDGDTTPDSYSYGTAKTITSAKSSVEFYLYYNDTLVDNETIPVVKDGDPFVFDDLTEEEKEQLKGEHYEIKAAVTGIGYTMTGGYAPSKFVVSEYHVKGATRVTSNKYYMYIYGIKSTGETFLTSTASVQEYMFDAGSYQSYAYESFRFELRESNSASSTLIDSTTVGVAKQGDSGANGVMPRYCGFWNTDSSYVYDSSYRDVVIYNGNVFQVAAQGKTVTSTPPSTATSNEDWEVASKFSFVAMDTALISNANIAGFTFTYTGDDEQGRPIGVLESQNGTLKLDAANGEITAQAGNIGGFVIGEYTLVNEGIGLDSYNMHNTISLTPYDGRSIGHSSIDLDGMSGGVAGNYVTGFSVGIKSEIASTTTADGLSNSYFATLGGYFEGTSTSGNRGAIGVWGKAQYNSGSPYIFAGVVGTETSTKISNYTKAQAGVVGFSNYNYGVYANGGSYDLYLANGTIGNFGLGPVTTYAPNNTTYGAVSGCSVFMASGAVTLPSLSSLPPGRMILVINNTGDTIKVSPTGTDKIRTTMSGNNAYDDAYTTIWTRNAMFFISLYPTYTYWYGFKGFDN